MLGERGEGQRAHEARHAGDRLAAEGCDDLAQPRGAGFGIGLIDALDDVMAHIFAGPRGIVASQRHPDELLDRRELAGRGGEDFAGDAQPRADTLVAADLSLRQRLVEAEVRIVEPLALGAADAGMAGREIVEGEADRHEMRADRNQRQAHRHLDAEHAAIAGEQAGEVRAVIARRRRCGGGEQFARREHHVDRHHRLRRYAIGAAAVAQRILADAAADGGDEARERPPERRAQAMFGERVLQPRPGHAGADGDDGIGGIDRDVIERGGIEQHMAAGIVDIAVGIGRAAAARYHRDAGRGADADRRLHRRDRRWPHDQRGQAAGAVDVVGHHRTHRRIVADRICAEGRDQPIAQRVDFALYHRKSRLPANASVRAHPTMMP